MILLKGVIQNRQPIVYVTIDENGNLRFSSDGEHSFIIDTGFTGDFLVPRDAIRKLRHKFLGFEEIVLATNHRIKLPVYEGWVRIKNKHIKVVIIEGDQLIGMSFLEKIGSRLSVDLENATVKLSR